MSDVREMFTRRRDGGPMDLSAPTLSAGNRLSQSSESEPEYHHIITHTILFYIYIYIYTLVSLLSFLFPTFC